MYNLYVLYHFRYAALVRKITQDLHSTVNHIGLN